MDENLALNQMYEDSLEKIKILKNEKNEVNDQNYQLEIDAEEYTKEKEEIDNYINQVEYLN